MANFVDIMCTLIHAICVSAVINIVCLHRSHWFSLACLLFAWLCKICTWIAVILGTWQKTGIWRTHFRRLNLKLWLTLTFSTQVKQQFLYILVDWKKLPLKLDVRRKNIAGNCLHLRHRFLQLTTCKCQYWMALWRPSAVCSQRESCINSAVHSLPCQHWWQSQVVVCLHRLHSHGLHSLQAVYTARIRT